MSYLLQYFFESMDVVASMVPFANQGSPFSFFLYAEPRSAGLPRFRFRFCRIRLATSIHPRETIPQLPYPSSWGVRLQNSRPKAMAFLIERRTGQPRIIRIIRATASLVTIEGRCMIAKGYETGFSQNALR